jgi:(2R)-sulfolactate sulfo-lyase subunit beta
LRYTFLGFERPDGRVGTRNHVVIIPVDDISNTAAEGVSKLVYGTTALTHPYGRLQFGKDLELHFRTLIGTGSNPNVAAAIVIGIEPNWTNKVADGIARTGKPVEAYWIEGHGDLNVIERASRKAKEFVQDASELRRREFDISELVVSIKCGESDTTSGLASNPAVGVVVDELVDRGATVIFGETTELTGAEHVIARRMANEELRRKFLEVYNEYVGFLKSQGVDLLGSQPTQGNIAGGISTIEEKALGNIQKTGTKPIVGVLDYAETPKTKGLHFMNTPAAAAEALTLFAAAGSNIHLFTTGQGNVVGHPIMPVIKITANPKTAKLMSEHIDIDLSDLLKLKITLKEAGEKIINYMLRVCSGRLTAAEVLGHREFALVRLHRSA